jgi:hypothetical protein
MAKHRGATRGWAGLWLGLAFAGCSGSGAESDELASADEAPAYEGPVDEDDEGRVEGLGISASTADPGPLSGAPTGAAGPRDAAYDVPGAVPEDPAPMGEGGPGANEIQSGTLTAGTWDDSQNLERFLEYRGGLADAQTPGLPLFDEQAHRDAAVRAAQATSHATLDIALVIDTTGSMGDELRYLQSEFDALSSAIEAQYPEADQRWALVVYRDVGDEYVTRSFDFQAAGVGFRERLRAQSAGGGGDYPEASEAALAAMNQLAWRSDPATARLAFWVGDAPHHGANAEPLAAAVEVASSQDVHVYPVASSGVDELTEYTMRSAAQLTLGRYLFLTNDSGVGGDHKEPTIPCYFVTRLDHAILRMIDIEMSGVYREPSPEQVIRSGGDPADGACRLESGQTVFVY